MTLTRAAIVELPFQPELTQASIAHLCRRLPHLHWRGEPSFNHLRQEVAAGVVRLALLRWLGEQGVAYTIEESFSLAAEPADLLIGGRRCRVVTELVARKALIRSLKRQPDGWLTRGLPPSALPAGDGRPDADLLIFAALCALATKGRTDLDAALAAGQPHYLLAMLPASWRQPAAWQSLTPLALKLEIDESLELELGGLGSERQFLHTRLQALRGRQQLALPGFHALAYLHTAARPTGRVGLSSATIGHSLVLELKDWGNLWLYGLRVVLLGYLPAKDWPRSSNEARKMTAASLRPIADLVNRARQWAAQQP